jgi:hypothetical protein
MKEDRDVVLFRIDRKVGLLLLAALAVVFGSFALAQQLTLTTSYPVPSGIYNQLITTGNSGSTPADTTLNMNAGNTILVPASNANGQVVIGAAAPAGSTSKLYAQGGIQLGDDAAACNSANVGTQRWHGNALQICNGSAWGAALAETQGNCVWIYGTNAAGRTNGGKSVTGTGTYVNPATWSDLPVQQKCAAGSYAAGIATNGGCSGGVCGTSLYCCPF